MKTVIDLFCGAGGEYCGIHRAFEAQGEKIRLFAVNHWQTACETHAANFPQDECICFAFFGSKISEGRGYRGGVHVLVCFIHSVLGLSVMLVSWTFVFYSIFLISCGVYLLFPLSVFVQLGFVWFISSCDCWKGKGAAARRHADTLKKTRSER